jgi:hypothetical protein
MNSREFIIAQFRNGDFRIGQCLSISTLESNAKNIDPEIEISVREEVNKMIKEGTLTRGLESTTLIHLTRKGFELF